MNENEMILNNLTRKQATNFLIEKGFNAVKVKRLNNDTLSYLYMRYY